MRCYCYFFFQAEDGIRDLTVTGVQTCALPILVRLDRYLGRFLEQLFVRYGKSNVLVVLTADHGVTPFPERSRMLGHPGAVRVIPDTIFQRVNAALDQRAGGGDWLQFESGMLLLPDRAKLVDAGVNADSVVADVATRLRALAGVARVDPPADLTDRGAAGPGASDPESTHPNFSSSHNTLA